MNARGKALKGPTLLIFHHIKESQKTVIRMFIAGDLLYISISNIYFEELYVQEIELDQINVKLSHNLL